jgi:mono/diheme cytochrome c family protein
VCNIWSCDLTRIAPLPALILFVASRLLFSTEAAASELDRGKYLVEALAACDNCHTPRSADGYDDGARFSGGSQSFAGPGYSVRGGNITPDRESGVGDWSDNELRAAITQGFGRAGKLAPFMPSESYAILTDRDAGAIIAYMRSASPVSGSRPQQRQRLDEARRPSLPGAGSSLSEDALRDRASRGLYVASLARCMGCHSGESNDIPDHVNRLGAGGKTFRTPAGVAVASNITSDPENGVGSWSDEELKRAITQGVSRDGRTLKPTMANLSKLHFSKISTDDLDALVGWLRTIPPRK